MANKPTIFKGSILLLIFVSAAFYAGCNTYDADFERGNPLDPKSPNFVHSKPSNFTVTVEDELINIGWRDRTEYNDGYLIEKAINDSTQFEEFATLPGDSEGFSDDSRKIGQDTYYRVSSFEIENDAEKIVHSELISISVEIIHQHSFFAGNNNIDLRWNSSTDFVDGFRIEEKSPSKSTYTVIDDLTDVSDFGGDNQYAFTSELQSFQTDVRLVAYQYHDDQMVDIHTEKETLFINSITSMDVTFNSETETLIEWGGIVDFAEHYLLELSRGGEVVGQWEMPPTGSFLLETPQIRGGARYSVKGFHEGIESRTQNRNISFPNIRPQISISSSSLDELGISWDDPFSFGDVNPTQFTVERRTDNLDFEEISVLPGDHFNYTDTNLDPENTYTYRVRTLTSTPSNPIKVENKNLYAVTNESDVSFSRNSFNTINFHFFDEKNVAVHGRNITTYPVTFFQVDDLTVVNDFDSGNEANAFALSPDGKRAVEVVKGNTAGGYDMNIWNLETTSLEHVLQDIVINTETSYSRSITRYSPSGELIAIGEAYTETEISFWNPDNGEFVNSIEVPGKDLNSFYFNPLVNEFFVVTSDEILVYDLNSFEAVREIPIVVPIWNSSQLLVSEREGYFLISTDFKIYKVDMATGTTLDEIRFDNSIEFISANKNFTEILVHTFRENVLIDPENFEKLQSDRWIYPQNRRYMVLNEFMENTAVSIERKHQDFQWSMKKWERRAHWYEIDPYGE